MKRGLVRVLFSITPAQLEALRVEATSRAAERKRRQLDTGEIVRELLDLWMKRGKR